MARTRRKTQEEKTTINRQDFIDALTKVKPGLANKEIMEQSTHFIFDDDKIWTYNDQITIMQPFQSGLTGAVKAESFYKLLNKITDEEISITEEDKGQVKISGKKIKAVIKIDPEVKIDPIQIPGTNSKKWEKLPENFHEAIAFCSFSASRNMIRPELTCLYIADGFCIGCDTFKGTQYKLDSKLSQEFLLPATAAVHLANYNPYKIIADAGWLHFINKEKTTFSCRTYPDEEYPEKIWEFFEVEGDEISLPEDFRSAIERAEILLTADFDLDRIVSLVIEEDEIICRGEGDTGWIEERADIKYDGEKIDINVHPILLADILKHLQTVVVGDRLMFEGENFKHAFCLSM